MRKMLCFVLMTVLVTALTGCPKPQPQPRKFVNSSEIITVDEDLQVYADLTVPAEELRQYLDTARLPKYVKLSAHQAGNPGVEANVELKKLEVEITMQRDLAVGGGLQSLRRVWPDPDLAEEGVDITLNVDNPTLRFDMQWLDQIWCPLWTPTQNWPAVWPQTGVYKSAEEQTDLAAKLSRNTSEWVRCEFVNTISEYYLTFTVEFSHPRVGSEEYTFTVIFRIDADGDGFPNRIEEWGDQLPQYGRSSDPFDPNDTPINDDPSTYLLTTAVQGNGMVTPDNGRYASGSQVQVLATANAGWSFSHWEGDGSGNTNPLSLIMDRNRTVRAVFVQEIVTQYELSTQVTGSGYVTPSGGMYNAGQTVTLTANANAGWTFSHWEGDASGSSTQTNVVMNGNRTVRAVFVQEIVTQYELSTQVTGSGYVTPSGGMYNAGQTVTLTANANAGWTFSHWEGDASGSSTQTNVAMNGNRTVRAVFVQNQVQQYFLTVETTGPGTVSPGSGSYDANTAVTLTATPNPGDQFQYWIVNGINRGSQTMLTLTMDQI